jgi:hypothetical protein
MKTSITPLFVRFGSARALTLDGQPGEFIELAVLPSRTPM